MPLRRHINDSFSEEKITTTLNINPIVKHLISEKLRYKNIYIYTLKLRKYAIIFCYQISIFWGATYVYKEASLYTKSLTMLYTLN